jgi:hypothetical protein
MTFSNLNLTQESHQKRRRRSPAQSGRRKFLCLETLEDRRLLSTTVVSPAYDPFSSAAQLVDFSIEIETTETFHRGFVSSGGTVTIKVLNGITLIGSPETYTVGNTSPGYLLPAGLALGNYTVSVDYSGGKGTYDYFIPNPPLGGSSLGHASGTFSASSGTGTLAIVPPTNTVLRASDPSVLYGMPETFTATVSPPPTPPTSGLIALLIDGVEYITDYNEIWSLNSQSQVSITLSSLAVGTHTITADYLGNQAESLPSSGSTSVIVTKYDKTTTTATASVASALFGQSVNFHSAVVDTTASGTTPTGAVQFQIDGVNAGSPVTLAADGTANYPTTSLAQGTHTITENYLGNATTAPSTGTTTITVLGLPTTTTVSPSLTSPDYGQADTFTASVLQAGVATSGLVQFLVDGVNAGSPVSLANDGTAKFTTASLVFGQHTVTADYLGTSANATSNGSTTVTVLGVPTTTSLTTSLTSLIFGQADTLKAMVVNNSPGGPTPSGWVQFSANGTPLADPVMVGADGTATLTTAKLPGGDLTITADFSDTIQFESSEGSVSATVTPAATTTILSTNLASSIYGQPVTYTIAVTPDSPTIVAPSGLVEFLVDGSLFTTASLDQGGTASIFATIPTGLHVLTALYLPDNSSFLGGSGQTDETVSVAPSTTTVTPSTSSLIVGQSEEFTALVSANAPSQAIPTGSVQFQVDGVNAGSPVPLDSFGSAQFNTATLSAGTHTITATYVPDINFSSSSGSTGVTVAKESTTTTVTPSTSTPIYGQPITFTATISEPETNSIPTGSVQFLVDGVNYGSPVVLGANGSATLTLPVLHARGHSVAVVYLPDSINFAASDDLGSPFAFAVAPAPLMISVGSTSKTYGAALPTFAVSYQGFVNNDSPDNLATKPTISTTATAASPVGSYAVTASGAVDSDYAITYQAGTIGIVAAPLTITANSQNVPYGTSNPVLTASFGGFVNGDGAANLSSQPKFSTTATASSLPGSYAVTVSGAVDPNYTISYLAGVLKVVAASTTTVVTASSTPLAFGQSETFTANVGVASPSSALASGSIQFTIDGKVVGLPIALLSGQASYTTSSLGLGVHVVSAVFSPSNTNFSGSNDQGSPVAVTITPANTTTSVTSPLATPVLNHSVTFTAIVGAVVGTPTGLVTFKDLSGGVTTVLGSASLAVVNGVDEAVFTTKINLALGLHSIVASYAGVGNYLSSTSAALTLTVHKDPTVVDFDGDGAADLTIYGPIGTTGKYGFQTLTSSTGFNPAKAVVFNNQGYGYGGKTSIPVTADFFGDGKSAYALWTPNSLGGMTLTAASSVVPGETINANFGTTTDIPVIADVDGDGKADFGVYGFQQGLGYRFDFLLSSAKFSVYHQYVFNNNGYGYGNSSSIPVVADFDGSGKAGFGLFNPSTTGSTFTYISPSQNISFSRTIGNATDIPMAVNYDGDGKADLALYGPDSTGKARYAILNSSSGYSTTQVITDNNNGYGYGNSFSIPVVADYQGTGLADIAVYTTDFAGGMVFDYQREQTGAGVAINFGVTGDIPLTAPSFLAARLVRARS